jgi:hyperosmotically inducible periplasmic protein
MKWAKTLAPWIALLALGWSGCSTAPTKSPDVHDSIRNALDGAGLKNVSVSQDRTAGVVTLGGEVEADADKTQAESIARSIAGSQVVSDQIAIRPPGDKSDARKIDSDIDTAIEKNFDALLIQNKLDSAVKFDVKSAVITLRGNVNSQTRRAYVERLATGVPNVRQVVNELQVKDQKATASN